MFATPQPLAALVSRYCVNGANQTAAKPSQRHSRPSRLISRWPGREMAALQAATRAISIVFMQVNNSVKQGSVASLARSPRETLRESARAPGNDPNQRRRRGDLAGVVAAGAALVRSERFTEVIRAAHSRLSS